MIHKGNNQRWPEFHTWASLCLGMGIQTYLELGCGSAGHMRLAGVNSIAIDINEHTNCIDHLMGNSHDPNMIGVILDHFKGALPDAVFIDASHTCEDAKADFDQWWPLARKLVGFHDILMPEVAPYWNDIKRQYPSIEIIAKDIGSVMEWQHQSNPDIQVGGIGVLFKETL